jgi:hypothetical protein
VSNQVVRLVTGDTIEIRTGAIQGIGPQGNTGPQGPIGPEGPSGADSTVPGPTGAVTHHASLTRLITPATLITGATSTGVKYDSTLIDDLDTSATVDNTGALTTITVPAGRYYVSATLRFALIASPTGVRALEVYAGSTQITGDTCPGFSDYDTYLSAETVIDVTSSTVLTVKAAQTQGASLSMTDGRFSVSAVGPGIQGPVGPTGPEGPAGPASTVPGPAGTLSPTTTFADLGG